MIELELKYQIEAPCVELENFPVVKSLFQEDMYYDTKDYHLIRNGNFLRVRNNERIDFKLNTNDLTHLYCKETSFKTVEVERKNDEINAVLKSIGLSCDQKYKSFKDFVNENGLVILSPIRKNRKTYQIDEKMKISVDEAENIGTFLEAEIMVDADNITPHEANKIKENMIKILKEKSLLSPEDKAVNIGYVELYLEQHNRQAYDLGLYKR